MHGPEQVGGGSRSARLLARGRVQGVGYRWFVRGQARGLRLTGWVRNLRDGTVEAEVHGEPSAIEVLVERMRAGPAGAAVSTVGLSWLRAAPEAPSGFEILPTD
jgi:acylphosphatase